MRESTFSVSLNNQSTSESLVYLQNSETIDQRRPTSSSVGEKGVCTFSVEDGRKGDQEESEVRRKVTSQKREVPQPASFAGRIAFTSRSSRGSSL